MPESNTSDRRSQYSVSSSALLFVYAYTTCQMRKLPFLLCLIRVRSASTAYTALLPSLPLPSFDCLKIALQTWVLPAEARACMSGVSFKEEKRQNVRSFPFSKFLSSNVAPCRYSTSSPRHYPFTHQRTTKFMRPIHSTRDLNGICLQTWKR